MAIERFEDIKSWQLAKELAAEIHKLTMGEKFKRDSALKNQIYRAAISIGSNIAEGFGRRTRKEFINFLGYANGSALEVQSHLYIALEAGHVSKEQFEQCYELAHRVSRLIGGFIKYLTDEL